MAPISQQYWRGLIRALACPEIELCPPIARSKLPLRPRWVHDIVGANSSAMTRREDGFRQPTLLSCGFAPVVQIFAFHPSNYATASAWKEQLGRQVKVLSDSPILVEREKSSAK